MTAPTSHECSACGGTGDVWDGATSCSGRLFASALDHSDWHSERHERFCNRTRQRCPVCLGSGRDA